MNKKIIISLVLIIMFIFLVFLFNNILFYEKETSVTSGHYEKCVYITQTGECYHSEYCSYVEDTKPIGEDVAINNGYKKCSYCKGRSFEFIYIEHKETIKYHDNFIVSSIMAYFCVTIALLIFYITKKPHTNISSD